MQTFAFLTYSATALISALNIASVVAVPGAESPAYKADLPAGVEEYVYSFARGDDSQEVTVPSYSWAFGDDAEYKFPVAESESKSGSHARRAEPPKAPATIEQISNVAFWLLAPAEQQPPPPAAAFVPAPFKRDPRRVYYRPFQKKPTQDGKIANVPATEPETRANPAKIAWAPYRFAGYKRVPEGPEGKLYAVMNPLPQRYAVKDLAVVREKQEALANKSATATATATATPSAATTFSTVVQPSATLLTAFPPSPRN